MQAKRLFILPWVIGAIVCLVGLYASWHFFMRTPHSDLPTADLTVLWQANLPDQAGNRQALAQYQGHPLVVNFWATWCEPCREEMPALLALRKQYASKEVYFIGIAVDSAANVGQFLKKAKIDYPLYSAGYAGLEMAHALGNTAGGLPFTILIDAQGQIRSTLLGSITRDKGRLKTLLQQLDLL